ncbi:hypothetical protein AA313_de0204253 [Arthrobotrys entomopaga]|nr:hypothetical protein AA313_de0204253 [Arthrobotrys entomopaga]
MRTILAILVNCINWVEATIRSTVLFLLAPFFYVANAVLALLSRRSKTAAGLIVKAKLIRDVIFQPPPPPYQSTTKADQDAARLRMLDASVRRRESELVVKTHALERKQQHIEAERQDLDRRIILLKESERSIDEKSSLHRQEIRNLAAEREKLDHDVEALKEEQHAVQQLRDQVGREREAIERHRSENTLLRKQLHEEREKQDAEVIERRKHLDERQTEINDLHDRFLRSQLESMEHHRSEHDALVQSLQSRLSESVDQHQRAENLKTELEQRLSFLTNELADRTEREFNLGSELGELRQKLSDERGSFNRMFGELSRSLSDLKSRCARYEEDLAAEKKLSEDLKAKESSLTDLENDISAREQLLQAHAKSLDELEGSLKTQKAEQAEKEQSLEDREKSLETKSKTLQALETTLEERTNHITEAEKSLEIRTKGHEDALKHIAFHEHPEDESVDDSEDVPDTSSPISVSSNPSTPIRPTIRERVSRRTSEFVGKVNSVTHRRSTSYSSHKHGQETPPRLSKSRDGLKAETK